MLASVSNAQSFRWNPRGESRVEELRSGDRVQRLRADRAEELYFRIYVPADADTLDVRTRGGRGDADIYVRFGELPGKAAFDGRSSGNTATEQIVVRNPREGWWYVTVRAFTSIEDVELQVRHDGRGGHRDRDHDDVLRDDERIDGLEGRAGEMLRFRVNVPRQADRLTVRLAGGRGDADLYLARGYEPEPERYEHRSVGRDTREEIDIRRPAAGTWYVMVYAYRDFEDADLRIDIAGDYDDHDRPDHRGGLRLTRPGRGTTWHLGDTEVVTWRAANYVRDVQIQFSLDGGRTWRRDGLPQRIDADLGEYFVKLPVGRRWASDNARIRIVDVDGQRLADVSDRFRILYDADDDAEGDRYEDDDDRRRPSRILLGQAQRRTIAPEDDRDYVMFVPPRVGNYVATFERVSLDLQVDVLGLDRRNRWEKLQDLDVSRRGARMIIAAGHDVRAIMFRVRAEDDDDEGRYLLTVERHGRLPGRVDIPRRDDHRDDRRDDHQQHVTVLRGDATKVEHLSGREGSIRRFRVFVPNGTRMLSVHTEDGDGRFDMYVERNRLAGRDATWRSQNGGTTQSVNIRNPRSGWYHITLIGREHYRGAEIAALIRK
jgi:hypothetical protein